VLMEVRDETIKVTDQIVGVAWMKIQQGLEEQISQLLVRRDGAVFFCQRFIYTASPEKAEFEVLTFCVRVIHVRG